MFFRYANGLRQPPLLSTSAMIKKGGRDKNDDVHSPATLSGLRARGVHPDGWCVASAAGHGMSEVQTHGRKASAEIARGRNSRIPAGDNGRGSDEVFGRGVARMSGINSQRNF